MGQAQIAVKYIGRRPYWEGTLYNVKLRFDAGQTRLLPEDLGLKFLTHHDTFARDESIVATDKSPEQETQEAIEAARVTQAQREAADMELSEVLQRVDIMETEQLVEFASRYGTRLDMRKRLDNLRLDVKQLISLQGLI